MKNRVHIYPTENGWIVESFHSWTEHTACPGKQWSFETLDSLLRALPGILESSVPKDFKAAVETESEHDLMDAGRFAEPKSKPRAEAKPLPAAQTPAIYQP